MYFFKGDDWCGIEKGLWLELEFVVVGVEVVYFLYMVYMLSLILWCVFDVIIVGVVVFVVVLC